MQTALTVTVLSGPDNGRAFPDLPLPITIGRGEKNAVCLSDNGVSRYHAVVQIEAGELTIADRKSRNGTLLNGKVVTAAVLRVGDFVTVANTRLRFTAPRQANQFRELADGSGNLLNRCAEVRRELRTTSVLCTSLLATALNTALSQRDETVQGALGEGFHRVVIVDAEVALTSDKRPAHALLTEVCRAVGAAFGLELSPDRFHVEDVFQVLKDEPASLFCFLHFEHVPVGCLPITRAFTQNHHRALFLNEGVRDLATEEGASELSKVSDAVRQIAATVVAKQPPGAELVELPLPQQLAPTQTAQLVELFDYLHRGLASAVDGATANHDGTAARVGYAAWQQLLAVQFALARYAQRAAEDAPI